MYARTEGLLVENRLVEQGINDPICLECSCQLPEGNGTFPLCQACTNKVLHETFAYSICDCDPCECHLQDDCISFRGADCPVLERLWREQDEQDAIPF